MPDIVDAATRSRMMAGIAGKDTKPELAVRSALFARGLRFRVNFRRLVGTPDIVFPKFRAVIFVHGCFWHGHKCNLFRMPSTRTEFWSDKIGKNKIRDAKVIRTLKAQGWRTLIVYECAIKRAPPEKIAQVADQISTWLQSGGRTLSISASSAAKES